MKVIYEVDLEPLGGSDHSPSVSYCCGFAARKAFKFWQETDLDGCPRYREWLVMYGGQLVSLGFVVLYVGVNIEVFDSVGGMWMIDCLGAFSRFVSEEFTAWKRDMSLASIDYYTDFLLRGGESPLTWDVNARGLI